MSQKGVQLEPFWRISEWFRDLSTSELTLLKAYHADLLKWTKSINLISQGTVQEADRVHFADCIAGCRIFSLFVQPKGFLDLGSGNGFPGIVFAILNPGLTIECVDSDERKIVFIKQFALRNGLRNLSASCIRIENLNSPVFQATAKGLGALGKIFSLLEANTNSGSVLFLFKGPEWESEMKELTAKQCSTWNISVIGTYELPQNASHVSESRVILRALRT